MGKEQHIYRSLFIPNFYAHRDGWRKIVRGWAESADEVYQLGNFLNTNIEVNDKRALRKANSRAIKYFELWRATDDRFFTLVGPNEILTLNNTPDWMTPSGHTALRDGWFGTNPLLKVAAVSKGRLVTAAGLSHGEWLKIGAPDTAEEAADRLNEKYKHKLYFGPCWRMGNSLNFDANPVFAHPVSEVYNSWLTSADAMPFPQIHGLENLMIAPNHLLLSADYRLEEKEKFKKVYKWGTSYVCNDNLFIGIGTGIHDVLDALPASSFRLYMETTPLGEPASEE